jgi:hypothetical protein
MENLLEYKLGLLEGFVTEPKTIKLIVGNLEGAR